MGKWREKYQSASQIKSGDIPESFDLRNVNGVNMMGKQRDQGSCGSCYAMAFIYCLESRLKQQGSFTTDLSPQHTLSCNFLSEGCSGGWGVLNGYFAEVGGVMPESCAPYEGGDGKCSSYAGCEPAARVVKTEHRMPSGEDEIKREILMNGAVQTSWDPPAGF